ncbi:MAG: LysR family transcriptional regulator [Phycisphaerales bacterium]|nr:LysR family transcriptional regulator [Phycisphaerales bacterium]
MPSSPNTRYYKQNRLQQLRGFCHAARTGSFSKAADRMMLSQPSVSLQIQALEREFHTTLFERRGPKVELTPDGRLLYDLASSLVEGMDSLQDVFAARRDQVEDGTLDIAAGESTILYLLPEYIQRYCNEFPNVQLRLHNVTGREGLIMLRDGSVDFAVGSMMSEAPDIEYRRMFTYDPVLITAMDHPLTRRKRISIRDISAQPLILPPQELTTWRIVDAVFNRHGLAYRVRVEAGGWEVIKRYVELGLGVSIVMSICLVGNEKLASFDATRFFPKRSYGVVLRKGRFLSPQARRFVAMMAPEADAVPTSGGKKT